MTATADAVFALERALVAAATGGGELPAASPAAFGAVASRYLAVGTPRSFAIIGDGPFDLEAHRTWFAPIDIRIDVPIAQALAADIVCIHEPLALAASQLRRGTHVNALANVTLDDELRAIATIVTDLHPLAAGLVDGRQLDEITIYLPAVRA